MKFKEYIKNDIKRTFFNLENDEFTDSANINGVDVSVIEDKDKMLYRIKKDFDGLIIGDVLFYIPAEEYIKIPFVNKPKPNTNQAISYNGKPSTIVEVNEEMGIYEIIIQHSGGC